MTDSCNGCSTRQNGADGTPRAGRDVSSGLAASNFHGWRKLPLLALVVVVLAGCRSAPRQSITLATTTSVANSGLLDVLLAEWQRDTKINIRAHLVGSGRALDLLAGQQADVGITHAPALEANAIAEHPTWAYAKFMFNEFVIVGPAHDPAKVAEATTPDDAFGRIARSGHRFISRGDNSGTHERETLLWTMAPAKPRRENIVVAGQGMGSTLRIASETGSYTLTDRATFTQNQGSLQSRILCEGGPRLLNTYAVISPGAHSAASVFARWLTEGRGRQVIEGYRVNGVTVFTAWPRTGARSNPADLPH